MTTWTRARLECRCGCCGRPIYEGQPMRVIAFAAVRRRLVRCLDCSRAEGLGPPADLPPMDDLRPRPSTPMSGHGMTSSRSLARDFKVRQSGDDAA